MDTADGELCGAKTKQKKNNNQRDQRGGAEVTVERGGPEGQLSSCGSGTPWPRLWEPRRLWTFRLFRLLVAWLGNVTNAETASQEVTHEAFGRNKESAGASPDRRVRK